MADRTEVRRVVVGKVVELEPSEAASCDRQSLRSGLAERRRIELEVLRHRLPAYDARRRGMSHAWSRRWRSVPGECGGIDTAKMETSMLVMLDLEGPVLTRKARNKGKTRSRWCGSVEGKDSELVSGVARRELFERRRAVCETGRRWRGRRGGQSGHVVGAEEADGREEPRRRGQHVDRWQARWARNEDGRWCR